MDKKKLLDDLVRENPDFNIRDFLEIVKEIEGIIQSFEVWPVNFGWRPFGGAQDNSLKIAA